MDTAGQREPPRTVEELYDLQKDPNQLKNLANHPDYAGIRNELSQRLRKWRKETADPVTDSEEPFDTYPYYGVPRHP